MADAPFPAIVAGVTSGAVAKESLNKLGSDGNVAIKEISAIASVATEVDYFITGSLVFDRTSKKYYKYSGTAWEEYLDMLSVGSNFNLDTDDKTVLGSINEIYGVVEPLVTAVGLLGTISSQDSDTVSITGGSINGVKYGGANDYTSFEADGTMLANGDATTTEDIIMPLVTAKTGTANIPNWSALVGNINAYTFSVGDHLTAYAEFPHSYKEGSNFEIHMHWVTNGVNVDNRYVKWEVEYSIANMGDGTFTSSATPSFEDEIPASTASKTHMYASISTVNGTGVKIGSIIVARVRRIAADGTAPSNNPFGLSLGVHFLQDTLGSRNGAIK